MVVYVYFEAGRDSYYVKKTSDQRCSSLETQMFCC